MGSGPAKLYKKADHSELAMRNNPLAIPMIGQVEVTGQEDESDKSSIDGSIRSGISSNKN